MFNLLYCPCLQVGEVHLAQHQNTPHCWGEDAHLRPKAESWVLWRADNLCPLIHLLNSKSFQFCQLCLIRGLQGIKKAKKKKNLKIKHVIYLISGVSSAKIVREYSCKVRRQKAILLHSMNLDLRIEIRWMKKTEFDYCGGDNS